MQCNAMAASLSRSNSSKRPNAWAESYMRRSCELHPDAELFCEGHYLAVMLDHFEVRLPSYRLTLGDLVADFGALSSE